MKKVLLTIVFVLLLLLFGCSDSNDHEGEVRPPKSNSNLEGKDYNDVIMLFEDAGFENIETVAIEDLIVGWLTKDGEVEQVTIRGDENFSTSSWYSADSKVRIFYHTFPSDEDDKKNDKIENDDSSVSLLGNTISVEVGEFLIDIPDYWEKSDDYYYAEKGETLAMLMVIENDVEISSFEELYFAKEVYIEGITEALSEVKNGKFTDVVLNGYKAIRYDFDCTINDEPFHLEVDFFNSPNTKKLVSFMFGQTKNVKKDHFPEYYLALETLRLKDEETNNSKTENVNKNTNNTKESNYKFDEGYGFVSLGGDKFSIIFDSDSDECWLLQRGKEVRATQGIYSEDDNKIAINFKSDFKMYFIKEKDSLKETNKDYVLVGDYKILVKESEDTLHKGEELLTKSSTIIE